jgi:hypothetical protein
VDIIVGREITFTIENLGGIQLNLTGSPDKVYLSGTDANYFLVTLQPTSPVPSLGSTTFKLRTVRETVPPWLPIGWERTFNFTVNIPNDDSDENPYNFTIEFTLKKQ